MDLNLLPNRGPAEDFPGSSPSIDRLVAMLYQMIEEDDGFPTQWLTSSGEDFLLNARRLNIACR
ncbi:hypothetical protein ACSBR1_002416 [Camellia fascicularis]